MFFELRMASAGIEKALSIAINGIPLTLIIATAVHFMSPILLCMYEFLKH